MEITAVAKTSLPLTTTPAVVPNAQAAAQIRDVVRAVQAVNGTEMFGEHNQFVFCRDAATHRMVIRVVDTRTDEVVAQFPPEYLLRLAADLTRDGSEAP